MLPATPFWFKQRQGKIEEAGPNLIKVTGPNLKEAILGIREENGRWHSYVRRQADGPDLAATHIGSDTAYEAWEVAFEMYRGLDVV
ncbi:MAG: hypothetical protein HY040_02895 [Planctomycetes bacterium]|nr:hypothetical protein [Planctomycetota bacterium]